jgi:outer membrane protein OmpA-like peptidoglycan-associated protein
MSKEVKEMFRRNRGAWAVALIGLLLTVVAPTASYAIEEQSNHLAPFLRAGVGARYFGMGGTGSAIANDAAAGYWNPAGLSLLRGLSLSGMFTGGMTVDRNHNYVGAAYGWERFSLGLGWVNANMTDIRQTGNTGAAEGLYDFNDNVIMLSAATAAGPVNLGITGKLVTQGIGANSVTDDGANGIGFDLGAQFALTEYARLGVVVQDLFTKVGDQDQSDVNDVPSNLRFGAALSPVDGLTLGADVEKTRDDENYRFHGGAEYWVPLSEDFSGALRLGVDDGNFAGGFGLGIKFFKFDYAYVVEPQKFMDENHRFSLGLDFGERRDMYRSGGLKDRDQDGIPDVSDQCPDQPEDFDGYQDTDGCPDFDNDGDGILDVNDQCPDQAEDMDGFEDQDGCPDLDNDGDGILDVNDKCPNEAETVNGFEDSDGCPDEAPIYFPLAYINFKFATAEISGADPIPVLEEVVRIMKENPKIQVEIQGHTDNIGSDESNLTLSERRGQTVKTYLVNRGIDPSRLQTRGFGESRPIDSNDTDLGRARNRRIEFVVIK